MIDYNQNYEAAFNKLMEQEGMSYTNDPDDKGGPTKYGLTQNFLQGYYGKTVSVEEIQTLTLENAKEIYYKAFWLKNNYDQILSLDIASKVFSLSVNAGAWSANIFLQKSANILYGQTVLDIDGNIGEKTINLINGLNKDALIKIFICLAVERYRLLAANPGQSKFLLGWLNRLFK